MKILLSSFLIAFALAFNAESCPYQKMAEVDSKLFTEKANVNNETFAKISDLRAQGEKKLKIGDLDNAEAIFDKALSLLNK